MMSTLRLSNTDRVTLALGEYDTGWHDPVFSISRAREIAGRARAANADMLILPEMCTTGFTMEVQNYAEPANGKSASALSNLAIEHDMWIIAGLAMQRGAKYFNSALVFAPDGVVSATYDKQKLFGYGAEHGAYSPGTGPCIFKLGGLSFAVFVCFDLRFPELFREVGSSVDACIVIANWPVARQRHWEVLTTARAIENQCYIAAVNRTGVGGDLEYAGGSMIVGPWGDRIDHPADGSQITVGEIAREVVSRIRTDFPLPT